MVLSVGPRSVSVMTTTDVRVQRPLQHAVTSITAVLDELDATGRPALWSLLDTEVDGALADLSRVVSRARVRLAEIVAEGRRRNRPGDVSAASSVAWLAQSLQVAPAEATRLLASSRSLEQAADDPTTAPIVDAARSGEIGFDQAVVAVDAVAALPDEVADRRAEAGTVMRAAASVLDPVQLRQAGRRLVAVLDPDQGDRLLAAQLERDERAAVDRRSLVLLPAVAGLVRGRFELPVADAAVVTAALSPLAAPAAAAAPDVGSPIDALRPSPDDALRDARSPRQRMADALVEACRRSLGAGGCPTTGGERAQVVVTVGLDHLRRSTGAGDLLDGEPVAPSVLRRMACDAGVLPAVLGGAGQPLDVGREARTVPTGIRRALAVRDRGCAFPGCDRPPGWCDAHHIRHWADGGPTALANLVLLCGHHHRTVHSAGWRVAVAPDGHPTWRPPP